MPSKVDALSQLLDDILDDLSARFIINLPQEELSSVTRICFGLEQAHWFYEDFFRPQHPTLPSVNLRAFTAALFSHCPLLWKFSGQHEAAFDDFLKYKIRVPVRGAIMLNQDMTKCVLVKGWKASAGWGFPKGKIDQEEADHDCAVREVREECGFDLSPYVKEEEYIDVVIKEQSVRLYVVRGVPVDTKFEPQTRKEISKIDWFALNDLPTYKKQSTEDAIPSSKTGKFYMVAPFLGPLRRWIKRQRSTKNKKGPTSAIPARPETPSHEDKAVETEELVTEDVDAPSQALKLLLGIADVSVKQSASTNLPDRQTVADDSGSIDLASLFIKRQEPEAPVPDQPEAKMRTVGNNNIPIKLLNTSIEASILEQLRPANRADNQHFERPVNPEMSYRASPLVPHQQLPPWMAQQPFAHQQPHHGPTMHPNMRDSGDVMSHRDYPVTSQMPLPPPNLHMLQNNGPRATGPPGLMNRPDDEVQRRKAANPNASSLLALLKPRDTQQSSTHVSPATAAVGSNSGNEQPGLHRSQDHRPVAHTQSLLALLKPNASSQQSSPIMVSHGDHALRSHHERQDNVDTRGMQKTDQNTSKEAFLLNYLTLAAQSARQP